MTPYRAAWIVSIAFYATWAIAALWTAKAVRGNARASRTRDYLAYAAGFLLLFVPPGVAHSLWRDPPWLGWGLVVLETAAFVFGWWARLHLGRLWSGMIELREGHRVVDTGPYRLVRHPIYTALITGAWTLALVQATATGLAGAALLTAVMAWKAKREEAFLRRELGAVAYDAYAARTPMMAPFAPR